MVQAEVGETVEHQLAELQQHREADFRRDHPIIWWTTLVGPALLTVAALVLVYLTQGAGYTQRLLGVGFAAFFFFGKFIILGGRGAAEEASSSFTADQLFFLVMYMDLAIAMTLVFHIGFMFKLPLLGPRLSALVEDGRFILQSNPWMRRATFFGLVAFVVFPLAATGSVGASIFGRLLGMSRWATLAGTAIGSLLGCALMYFGAGIVNRYFDRDNPLLTIGGIAFVALIILLLNHRYQRMKADFMSRRVPSDVKQH